MGASTLKDNKNAKKSVERAMRGRYEQMSLIGHLQGRGKHARKGYTVAVPMLDEHIDWNEIIPFGFYMAFYKRFGRARVYELESFLRVLLLQRIELQPRLSQLPRILSRIINFSPRAVPGRTRNP